MKKLLCILSVAFATMADAQNALNLQWAKQIGDTVNDVGQRIEVDASGNVYTLGTFAGTPDLDPGLGTYTLTSGNNTLTATYLSKLDANGNFVWGKAITGTGIVSPGDLKRDVNGNLIITGSFFGTADFDPGAAVYNLSASAYDGFILKLDANGNFIWAVRTGGASDDVSTSVGSDANGNIYTCGYFFSVADFDPSPSTYTLASMGQQDAYILKLDAAGNFVWAKQILGSGFNVAHPLCVSSAGDVYVGNLFSSAVDIDPGIAVNMLTPTSYDFAILKLNSAGNFVWAKQFGGIAWDDIAAMTLSSGNALYITGRFGDIVDFDPGPNNNSLSAIGSGNNYILNLDTAGNYVWAKRLISINIKYLKLDGAQNIYACGNFANPSDFDLGPGIFNLSPNGAYDSFIFKLTSSGNFVLAHSFGGSGFDDCYGITTDAHGNIYTTGYFKNTVDFDPSPASFNLIGNAKTDAFIYKLGSDATGLKETTASVDLLMYPNPSKGSLNIILNQQVLKSYTKATICDPLGKVVLDEFINDHASQLNIEHLPVGVYFLNISENGSVIASKKIIKE